MQVNAETSTLGLHDRQALLQYQYQRPCACVFPELNFSPYCTTGV